VCPIVSRDYEAIYAYKYGLYEQCFCLSSENVDFVLYDESNRTADVLPVDGSDLYLLLDDECLLSISLARLCGVFDIDKRRSENLTQMTLSMYLLVQSKVRLRHSVTALIDILPLIQRVHDRHSERMIINRAMMAFIYRKTIKQLKTYAITSK